MTTFPYKLLTAFAMAAVLVSCAGVEYDLPPVSAGSGGERLPGKFIWHDLISDDVAATERFYSGLFAWKFTELPLPGAQYWMITLHGEPVGGMVNQASLPASRDISQWVSVLSSPDIDASARRVAERGGRVLRAPVAIGTRGHIAVFADPQGAIFAALETLTGDPADSAASPPAGGFLWHELWTPDPDAAQGFYASLSGLQSNGAETTGASGLAVSYFLLSAGEHVRAGIRSRPSPDVPPVWMPYLRLRTLADLEDVLGRVPGLGGEVLVPAIKRPAGGYMALIGGPSGAPIALQTWPDGGAAPGENAVTHSTGSQLSNRSMARM